MNSGPAWRHRSRWDRTKKLHRGAEYKSTRLPISAHHIEAIDLIAQHFAASNECMTIPDFDARSRNGAIDRYELRHEALIIEFEDTNDTRRLQLTPKAETLLAYAKKVQDYTFD